MFGVNLGIASFLTLIVIMGGTFVAIFIVAAPEIHFPTSNINIGKQVPQGRYTLLHPKTQRESETAAQPKKGMWRMILIYVFDSP